MGRPKLKKRKAQKHWCLAYSHLLPDLKTALSPPGLELSDGQLVDVLMATMHELIVEKRGIICDPEKLLEVVNTQFKTEFSRFFADAMTAAGHGQAKTFWNADGSVEVSWGDGRMRIKIPAKVFEGRRMNSDEFLREVRAEGRVS